MDNSNRYNSGNHNPKPQANHHISNSAQQQNRIKSNDFQGSTSKPTHQYLSSDLSASNPTKQMHHQYKLSSQQQYSHQQHHGQQRNESKEPGKEAANTRHKPQFSQMSVESPKFNNNVSQQQQTQVGHQKQRSTTSGAQQSRRQGSSATNGNKQRQNEGQTSSKFSTSKGESQKQIINGMKQQDNQQKRPGNVQSYSQSRYVSQKNEKDIKQITKIDLRNLNQLDDTIEEEDLEQQLRAAQVVSNAQSRSQSYAAPQRKKEELQVDESDSYGSEQEKVIASNTGRNVPSSTYHQITGEELRYELFFAPRNSNKGGQNEYFSYKEMVQMYQAEIKRRWDQRAQIKDRYVFPRVQKQKILQDQQKLPHRRHQSKTPVVMAQHNPKAAQDSSTPLMDSKGPSQNISLIPSEGKISPTKTRSKQSANPKQQYSTKETHQNTHLFQQQQRTGGSKLSNKQMPQQNIGSHFKNAMSSEHVAKSQRGMQGDHHHTQSATVVQIVKSSHDLTRINLAAHDKNNNGNTLLNQANVVPDSKRERRNQQQIQNMMKYNQNSSQQQLSQASKTPILLNHQNLKAGAAIKQQAQFQQESATLHLSRNGNLNDLQKPQIMSMQPQHRVKGDGQLLSYGNAVQPQMQLGSVASQQQIQTVNSHQVNIKNQIGGRSVTQVQQQMRPSGNHSYAIINNHQQKQSIDSFKKTPSQQHQQQPRHESQKVIKKGGSSNNNQHYTQYNKSFLNKQEVKKQSQGTRNTASIISVKSSKSPALSKQQKVTETKNQERTMTQQQMHIMAIGDQISQRQTTRSQIKSDQIPQTFTKFKSKASVNKNSSIISLNKFNEMQLNERESNLNQQQMVQISSNRAAQRKNLQYQNYKASIEQHLNSQGSVISGGGQSNRKSGTQSTDKVNQRVGKSSNNIQKFISDSNQQQMTRIVKNNSQFQKSLDTGGSLAETLDKPEDAQRGNNSVSPVKPKSTKLYQQMNQSNNMTGENINPQYINVQHSVGNIRQALTIHKKNITDQKSPNTKSNYQQAQVSIFDTSPDSQNYDNSKKKQSEILKNQHNFIVPYDESQISQIKQGHPDQYRTQNMFEMQQQKHGHSQSSDFQRYMSQQSQSSSAMAKNFIINNAVMTHQLDLSNSRTDLINSRTQYQNDMSVVIEAQRETNENLFDTQDNFDNGQRASKTQTVVRQPSTSENVAPDLSHESISFLQQDQIQEHQSQVMVQNDGNKKTIYKIFKDSNHNLKGPQIQHKSFNFKKEPKMIQKSIVTHNQTRSMQSIERPQSSKSQHRSDKQKKHNFQQQQHQQNQMFNEYNDTIESLTQIKNQRQRSSGINNNLSNFQTDSSTKLQTQSSNKHQKSFSKSSSKQNIPTAQQQMLAQQQQQIISNMNNGLTTSAPQATRLIQKQISGQTFSLNNMIGSRNVNQGLKNINSMKEQRIVNVTQDQINGSNQNMNTLQAHQSQQNLIQANDMILNMQKQSQLTTKLAFKHQAQRSQNQQSVLFKPTNIIQSNHANNKAQVQSRNPQLIPAQSSSIIYGASGGQANSFVGSMNQVGGNSTENHQVVSQNHQHFHSISSQHDLSNLQNGSNGSNFRRQMIRDGSQPSISQLNNNQKNSQTSLITLNMAVNNFPVNARGGSDTSFYGATGTGPNPTGQVSGHGASGVPSGYTLQIQPKIPKKKRQTNSYSGSVGSSATNIPGGSQNAMTVGKMLNAANAQINNSYGDNHALVSSVQTSMQHQIAPSLIQGQGQQYHHGQYQQIVQQSAKSSGNAKHRGKNNNSSSSVHSATNMKQNYQHHAGGYVGYHAIMNSANMSNVHSQKNIVTTASNQAKIKANSVYSQMHGQQPSQHHQVIPHSATNGPVSQMGVLRNTQMKPKK